MSNINKRILTSVILLCFITLGLFYYKNLWILLILIGSLISFLEFRKLIIKIWKKNKFFSYSINILGFLYLIIFNYLSYDLSFLREFIFFILLICILSDVGGYIIGKIIGGKKLTRISPNKTVSGSIGSFCFPLIPLFSFPSYFLSITGLNFIQLLIFTFFISFVCQTGDLFISFFKRKAKVKDTGTILPGHGGLLDRIDGLLFALPIAILIKKMFL